MKILPSAKRSPRIENGVIYFYEGDTFSIGIEVEIDKVGEDYEMRPEDVVEVTFYDCRRRPVYQFSESGITNNEITFTVDENITTVFRRGEYTYDMKLKGERVVTLAKDNELIVE